MSVIGLEYLVTINYSKMIKQYETVFIATPVLSDAQMKEAVAKYTDFIEEDFRILLSYRVQG